MKYISRLIQLSIILGALFLSACGSNDTKITDKIIQVAVSPASPPMLFQQNGQLQGIDLELFTAYCKSRGYQMKIRAYDWQGMLGAIASGQADVAFSGISITPERAKVMDFSQPYFLNSWHLVSLSERNIHITDLSQIKQYSLGYPRGMAYSAFIKDKLQPEGYYQLSRVKLYPTYNEAITDLKNGNLDLAFIEEPVFDNYKYKLHMPITSSYSFNDIDQLGFAFKKGSPLTQDFNKFLTQMGQKKIDQLEQKWLKAQA
ncbi:transporter substrate-binding domain-containing protein [Cysteiniphilum sp. QT6929]|uniref:transporter substrate-binding domain-containing protein n=1 Tax=Cysteiniphilum sp. QT6929 TaxID=2975055 RepID=UPI0024B352D2|nr:transporter substrate-binding domain-containing protein [Cysteiniphilum sp. QT6929]WHN65093.1 transporter substrate-binding domain-containing protein [Cysteiniphilum sp. QT6929]